MAKLAVEIGNGLWLKNPVMTASGTFGYGPEFEDFIDINALGGIVVKGTTGEKREGNPYPRMAETPSGMLNAVGLQNVGVDNFIQNIYPRIKHYDTAIVVNVSGATIEEYVAVAEKINKLENIPAIELNISCPNVKLGGMAYGTKPASAKEITGIIRKVYDKTLIVKLSPNVTNIAEMALAVEEAGADAVSLVNTFLGMSIDVANRKPHLSTITGGLSGPAIKPIALRMVWQVAKAVAIPVIGLGGIMNTEDALAFLMAGASAVQIGTANFIDPAITVKIAEGIEQYLQQHHFSSVQEIIGVI